MKIGGTALILALLATPAIAQDGEPGFNITQLLGSDFELKAAVAGPGGREILFLQGKLASGGQEIIVRCEPRPNPEEGRPNCERVY